MLPPVVAPPVVRPPPPTPPAPSGLPLGPSRVTSPSLMPGQSGSVQMRSMWLSAAGRLEALFDALHDLDDIPRILQLSADHEVDFLPPGAND